MEKQIIGDKVELEKDVWMVASARTTSRAELTELTEEQRKQVEAENRLTNEALVILDVFAGKLKILKADQIVGENKEGLLSDLSKEREVNLPTSVLRKYDPELEDEPQEGEPFRMLKETLAQMNRARELLIQGYIQNQKRNFPGQVINETEVRELFRDRFHMAALRGEYVQLKNGDWKKK